MNKYQNRPFFDGRLRGFIAFIPRFCLAYLFSYSIPAYGSQTGISTSLLPPTAQALQLILVA